MFQTSERKNISRILQVPAEYHKTASHQDIRVFGRQGENNIKQYC